MNEQIQSILIKQAKWQVLRKKEGWGQKLRQAAAARDSVAGYAYNVPDNILKRDVAAEKDK